MKKNIALYTLIGLISLSTTAVYAEGEAIPLATKRLIETLVEQGIITKSKADALIRESEAVEKKPAPVRVPYVPDFVRKEIKDEVKKELADQAKKEGWAGPGAVPDWVRNMKWEGELRIRYQHDGFDGNNAVAFTDVNATNSSGTEKFLNSTEGRDRMRVRARLGVTTSFDPEWMAGFRITTGSAGTPVTANQTLGNYGNNYSALIDRAYIRYHPVEWLNVIAGRFGNPWYGTDLLWAPDLGFDGVAVQATPVINQNMRGFVTVGAHPIQEVELSQHDKWLFGAQGGVDWVAENKMTGKVGLGYYKYTNVTGQTSPNGSSLNYFTAPGFTQKGNTYYNISSTTDKTLQGLASEYHLLNLTGSLNVPVFNHNQFMITADYVKNLGFDQAAVSARFGSEVKKQNIGYQMRFALGKPEIKAKGDWQVYTGYKRVESDAVLDAFTDSDFHLGGTNARGYFLGGSYGLSPNTFANFRYLSADSIEGPPFGIDVLQLDLNLRF